ncbi:response regulator, partial [Salmonella enterica subsp. enterica]
ELLATEQFDLVLMDGQMPVMDGYEATAVIRSGTVPGVNPDIPVVALTAHAMVGEDQKCLNVGMNDYLTKPLDRAKLIEVLGKYLPKA